MISSDEEDSGGGVILDGPFDPDAQATVSDYVDYTEYLPADVIRSLTLIRGLDERYLESAQKVHELTRTYGHDDKMMNNMQPMRKDVSHSLDRAINARESAYGEACRLYEVVDRHFERLDCIRRKLRAIPPPPAMVEPGSAGDAVQRRGRGGQKGAPATRITLRLDNKKVRMQGLRGDRRHMHADSPIASTEQSDEEVEQAANPRKRSRLERPAPARWSRQPGPAPGTAPKPKSIHRASVAGITTSSALALLEPPPEDAKLGGPNLPWLRLTEWEMTKLRKKMKKNAIWQPSEVMVHRELALTGRGWEGYWAAKAEAEATGAELLDCDDITNTYVPGQLIRKTEVAKDPTSAEAITKLSNRGMKLNEAKRVKREHIARELEEAGEIVPSAAAETARSSKKRKLNESGNDDFARTRKAAPKPARSSTTEPKSTTTAMPRLKIRNTSTPPVSRSRGATGRELRRHESAAPHAHKSQDRRKLPTLIASSSESSAAVSRRKAKPSTKKGAKPKKESVNNQRIDVDGFVEEVDPDEPRYCICGDVSFGVMICCENNDVGVLLPTLLSHA